MKRFTSAAVAALFQPSHLRLALAGENKSVVTYSARSGLLDPFGNAPYTSAIDAKGRVLMSGATPWDGVVAGVAARLQNDAVFRDGFE